MIPSIKKITKNVYFQAATYFHVLTEEGVCMCAS